MLRRFPLVVPACLSAIALLATAPLLRADDPPAPTPPPGYKVIYHDVGGGKRMPILVQNQPDPLRHANLGSDPLDPQKVFSETNPDANKTFLPGNAAGLDKSAGLDTQQTFPTKVYDTSGPASVYNFGSKSTFHTTAYAGTKSAAGYDQVFPTKSAPPDLDEATSAFAPMGAAEQNRTAPINARAEEVFASPDADKKFTGPEEDARHNHLKKLSNGQMLIENIPDRPLSIDEVKDLINHGFKPDLSQPPPAASKPLNDSDYQPEPLRIEPTSADDAPTSTQKVKDDDANDPVPSPGTMADPPENSEPLPNK